MDQPATSVWAGLTTLGFDYEEFDDQGDSFNQEQGWLPGATAGFTYASQQWLFGGSFHWTAGDAEYTSPTTDTTTDEELLDIALFVDAPLFTQGNDSLHLTVGGGYHAWWRDIRSTPHAFGLNEIYRWKYALIGLRSEHRFDPEITLTTAIQLTRTLSPEVSVDFRQHYDNTVLALGEENGFRLGLSLMKSLGDGIVLQVSPWYETWKLGRSADDNLSSHGLPVGTVFEPRSETHDMGIDLTLCWRFELN